jgi:hypothetical protein
MHGYNDITFFSTVVLSFFEKEIENKCYVNKVEQELYNNHFSKII